MRFVAVKSEDQQATLMAHKTRELLIKQRTMSVNALRGHLAEFGVIAAKGISHVEELVESAAAADLPAMVQATLEVLLAQLRSLDAAIDELERAIVADLLRQRRIEGARTTVNDQNVVVVDPEIVLPLLVQQARASIWRADPDQHRAGDRRQRRNQSLIRLRVRIGHRLRTPKRDLVQNHAGNRASAHATEVRTNTSNT